jgi:thiol-disulfide isomerase/thioredoxin
MNSALAVSLSFLAICAVAAGCKGQPEPVAAETKRFRPADEVESSPAAGAADAATPVAVARSADQQGTKGGDSAQANPDLQATLEQLDRLAMQQPKGNTQQEQLEDLVRIHTQRLAIAKKALAMNPSADVKPRIVMAMFEIHQVFAQLGTPNAMKQLTDFAKTMSADADPEIARIGRHAMFTGNLSRIASQPVENGKEIASEAKKLLDAEAGNLSEDTQQLVGQAADMLTQSGFKDDAAGLIESLAAALKDSPQRGEQAARYSLIAKLVRADFDTLLEGVLREQEGAEDKLVAAVKTLLTEVPPGRDLLNRTQTVAHILESTGRFKSAEACYDAIVAAFKDVDQQELADAKDMAEKARQRMGLVGQPLKVEGVLADGQPFDWTPYEGKVVLVDFWASWCGPCIEEIPNIKQNFEQFHAKGFEVVGVNLNTNPADLKQFLTLQDLPWATVTTQEVLDGKVKENDWTSIPMAAKCGVHSIPFVVLIGKDGNVDSIHVRGTKLKNRLTALLGEPITTEVPSDPTQPPPPAGRSAEPRPGG